MSSFASYSQNIESVEFKDEKVKISCEKGSEVQTTYCNLYIKRHNVASYEFSPYAPIANFSLEYRNYRVKGNLAVHLDGRGNKTTIKVIVDYGTEKNMNRYTGLVGVLKH